METDSILIKGKRGRFPKRQRGCLKGSDGVKLIRRKYISISEVISLSYIAKNIHKRQKVENELTNEISDSGTFFTVCLS
jgi:hypothetical protein